MARGVCSVDGCGRSLGEHGSKGMCGMHSLRVRRHGSPHVVKSRFGRERGTTARASVSPTNVDIAWAAGFVEGEGSFSRVGTPRKDTAVSGSMSVIVPQKEREPLDKLVSLFGGNIHWRRKADDKGLWVWCVSGGRARGVAMTLYSWLSTRRRRQVRAAMGV